MPVFADLAAMQERFEDRDLLQLSDAENAGVLNAARIDQALESADATITSHVAARHKDVAQLAGNAVLKEIACDLAFHRLWRSNPPEWVETRKKDAMKALRDIAQGVAKLDGGTEEVAPRPGAIFTGTDPKRFGRQKLDSY